MNVSCPHCRTVFRVDPQKVPAAGIRARCSICRGIIDVKAVQADANGAVGPKTAGGAAAPADVAPPPSAEVALPVPDAVAFVEPPPAAAIPAPKPVLRPPPPPTPAAPPARPAPSFGNNDPAARARRLARALVSDMLMYHPDRRDRGLREGTLRQEFRDEIKKSWEEYVAQVGAQIAQSTPHFRDALNDILAKGDKVF